MKFYLSNELKGNLQSIFLSISLGTEKVSKEIAVSGYKGIRFRYYTGINIPPKYWDKTKQEVRSTYPNSAQYNFHLNELKARWIEIKLKAHREGIQVGKEDLKLAFHRKNPAKKKTGLMTALDEYIQLHQNILERGTIKNFITLKKDLEAFQKTYDFILTFDSIDESFRLKFTDFLFSVKQNTDNTVSKMFDKLRTFLNWAATMNYHSETAYKRFRQVKRSKQIVYLQEEELMRLQNFDFSGNPRLDRTRDMFCLGCNTGLRYSDIITITPENVQPIVSKDGKKKFELVKDLWKVKKSIRLLLNDYSASVLKKYLQHGSGRIFPKISNQKYNQAIKEMAQACGFDQAMEKVLYAGSKRKVSKHYKYDLLTSHSARHTYAILSIRKGIPITTLKELLGHNDLKTTLAYLKTEQSDMNNAVEKYWNP